ncbi:MAG TPA: phage baseplate assembly protein V [Mycobacteriales bacterium]|nr:phage baseplate assembly protein V [Mycobacteriales bacterium]
MLGAGGGDATATRMASVKIGDPVGIPLLPTVDHKLMRVVVDTHLHLPDMFELTFLDEDGKVLGDAGISIGTKLSVYGAKPGSSTSPDKLIAGEVTSIEAICEEGMTHSVVRGYEKAHRLQRARRTKTFLNMKDSDVARKVASDAGLKIGTIDETKTSHNHIAQVAQTDWEFLVERSREIGYEVGVTGGKFFFRKASGQPAGGGLGGALAAVASALGLAGNTLTFKDNLLTFYPRISAANITPDVEVRVWDAKAARVAVANTAAKTYTATIDGQDPASLASSFTDGLIPIPKLPTPPSLPFLPKLNFGTAPSDTAYVVVNRPLAVGSAADSAVEEAAKGLADHVASTFAEAEGVAVGDPAIQAGAEVTVAGVPKPFAGKWIVTNARHVFDPEEGGYHVRFYVSGRQNRSLHHLASGGAAHNPALHGLVCGVVTNCKDPDGKGKVKVAMPWLTPNYESDWARVVQFGGGRRSGATFLPEVGDEVLIGFEYGDPRRPYVIGGLLNDNCAYEPLASAVNGSGTVIKRGLASPAGNKLLFTDDLPPSPPGTAPPNQSMVSLGTGDDKLGLVIDQANGTVTLTCDPAPPASKVPTGTITVDCGAAGKIEIKTGAAGSVSIDGGMSLSLKAKTKLSIECEAGPVQIKGQVIQLN